MLDLQMAGIFNFACKEHVVGDAHLFFLNFPYFSFIFTCVSYAEARNRYRLDVRPSVRHTLAPYQKD